MLWTLTRISCSAENTARKFFIPLQCPFPHLGRRFDDLFENSKLGRSIFQTCFESAEIPLYKPRVLHFLSIILGWFRRLKSTVVRLVCHRATMTEVYCWRIVAWVSCVGDGKAIRMRVFVIVLRWVGFERHVPLKKAPESVSQLVGTDMDVYIMAYSRVVGLICS